MLGNDYHTVEFIFCIVYLIDVHLTQRLGSWKNGGATSVTKKNGLAAENGAVVFVVSCESNVISFTGNTYNQLFTNSNHVCAVALFSKELTHREADSHEGLSVVVGYVKSTRVTVIVIQTDRIEENMVTWLDDLQRTVFFNEIISPARWGSRKFLDDVPPA